MDINNILRKIKKIIPKKMFNFFQPAYHYTLTYLSAIIYRFPAKKLTVIGVTGTKGKSSVVEYINSIYEEAGYNTALAGTVRFKLGEENIKNKEKMTMPGRFFLQRFLRNAVSKDCTHVILELTSEGAKQYRHRALFLNTLVFTNLAPEHIESHGSFEKYLNAKLSIAKELEKSSKKHKAIISNKDDEHGKDFLNINVEKKLPYSINEIEKVQSEENEFIYKETNIKINQPGEFSIYNALAAIKTAEAEGIQINTTKEALSRFKGTPGRAEEIDAGQDFNVIVDYAHTPDSLESIYKAFKNTKRICVLGSTGGGRDKWKRPEMGRIADMYCDSIILTNEDPYDEDPNDIIKDVKQGVKKTNIKTIIDRREAIKKALEQARKNDTVLITGKGTDPYIMKADGEKQPWSDSEITKEELEKLFK